MAQSPRVYELSIYATNGLFA